MYHKLDNQIWFCISLPTTSGRRFESGHQLQISVTVVTEIFHFLKIPWASEKFILFSWGFRELQRLPPLPYSIGLYITLCIIASLASSRFPSSCVYCPRTKTVNQIAGKIARNFSSIFGKTPLVFLLFRDGHSSSAFLFNLHNNNG